MNVRRWPVTTRFSLAPRRYCRSIRLAAIQVPAVSADNAKVNDCELSSGCNVLVAGRVENALCRNR
jgi:hypothetical protein